MLNQPVPDFSLPVTGGGSFQLSAQRGRPLVLYFYPKDSTPGCTTEAGQFRDLHKKFEQLGCRVYGVSRDSLKSHESFKTKLELPFELLVDAEEIACTLFGVIKMKNLYGKEVRGIERSTFLIDAAGVLRREWRAVRADGHAAEVLAAAESL
ncbi:putative peroxiredoxin bcp [mine drainage metagenome]|uniref:thioredoxin-dependent peroxiredoxin n=1 Tax=mine drainage metagenome TaxID=410659 RepID=A0A1J5SLF1_9ZZZZ